MNTIFLTLAAANDTANMSFGEIAVYGGEMALIGMSVVFAVLILLWGIIALFEVFFYKIPQNKQNAKNLEHIESEPTINRAPQVISPVPTSSSSKTVAIITAAVSAYRANNNESGDFRVVSFKKR